MAEKINFHIEVDRVLDLLCSQIYDSPLALLRENVQNAYDAILMRLAKNEDTDYAPRININVDAQNIIIQDNGIGMDDNALERNYWTAGASGKNNDEARKAGVVGTFGIGAMANFGVCKALKVITRPLDSEITYTSFVEKKNLSLTEKCISCESNVDKLDDYGTKVIATLDDKININFMDASTYLTSFVKYLPVPVLFNGKNISQADIQITGTPKMSSHLSIGDTAFDYTLAFNEKATPLNIQILFENFYRFGQPINGKIYLRQGVNQIYGLRNYFGLSPIPISSTFNIGGIVNLPTLVPTAGRDAVSRESVEQVMGYVKIAEKIIAEGLAQNEYAADNSRELLQYIKNQSRYDLAGNVCINAAENGGRFRLKDCKGTIEGKQLYYYEGSDKTTLQNFTSNNNIVLLPANDYTRHQVQLTLLKRQGVPMIPDTVSVNKIDMVEYSIPQTSIITKIKIILQEDYFLSDIEVCYGVISHDVDIYVKETNNRPAIYLSQKNSDVKTLEELYNTDYGYLEPMVKDFVRTKLYPKIAQYVPSSVRGGTDALYTLLQRKKELFTIEANDLGAMDEVMKEYVEGHKTFKEVLKIAKTIKNSQTMSVVSAQVGDITQDFGLHLDKPEKINTIKTNKHEIEEEFYPQPPILRQDVHVDYKVLLDKGGQATINGFNTFLALSDKMYRQYSDFFLYPHSTRVIWSMHKIIYIFTHINNKLTLYYDIDLEKKLFQNSTGGKEIHTATIITKDKIFVPVINELSDYFNITSGQLKFTVRFDTVNC